MNNSCNFHTLTVYFTSVAKKYPVRVVININQEINSCGYLNSSAQFAQNHSSHSTDLSILCTSCKIPVSITSRRNCEAIILLELTEIKCTVTYYLVDFSKSDISVVRGQHG